MTSVGRTRSEVCTAGCLSRWRAPVLIAAYALVVLAPLGIIAVLRPSADHGFIYSAGKNLALCAFPILALQFVLSARIKWIERPVGFESLFRFHRAMGVIALLLLLSHPVLLAAGSEWSLLWSLDVPWFVQAGKFTLVLLVTHVVLAVGRLVLRMEYQKWRRVHNVFALLILPFGFVHSWAAGGDLTLAPVRVLWVWLLMFAAIAYFWHRVVQPRWVSGWRYRVTDVRREAEDVWTIKLEPPPGSARFDYLPGQFQFLTFQRPGIPDEEHHWTLSSSPTQAGFVASTIKESGDFTQTIGRTQIGDTAWVEAPFGRFSYLLHPDECDLVFIAGGVGITPLMSMLRHMRDTASARRVLLIDANSTPADILFRDELEEMVEKQEPALKTVHVLSKAPDDWAGERGRLDEALLLRLCGDLTAKAFYICAPRPLADLAMRSLRRRGVAARRIHFERFSL